MNNLCLLFSFQRLSEDFLVPLPIVTNFKITGYIKSFLTSVKRKNINLGEFRQELFSIFFWILLGIEY